MNLSQISIRRPVLSTVMATAIVVFGVMGFQYLGVREYPAAERPIITVSTIYPGASASVVESQITEPLENEVNTVAGVRTLTSASREGRSTLTVEFSLGDDLDRAANDVRDRVAAAMRRLPPDVNPPIVVKADADGDPIVFLNVSSEQRDLLELTEIADNLFRTRLQTIEGVARVDIWGSKEYAMRLWLDPDRLAAYGLTPLDVRDVISRANIELPSGRVDGELTELTVRTLTRLGDDPEAFADLVLKQEGDRTVRMSDVARAEIGPLNDRTILKRDGVSMVGVVLRPQTGANEVAIVDEFYRRLEQIKQDLPEDLAVAIGFDTSSFVRQSIAEVKQTIFIALALVCLVIYFFLREVRSAVIPLITIPIALVGAFFIMYLSGFTINVLTLLALVLAIGLVVDDAVVVLENIYTKIEGGMDPITAGDRGIREIFTAVVATTLALTAVFLPIIFMDGLTGVLFREFGVTLAGAVIISSFIALTLTPMLATRILKKHDRMPRFYAFTEPFFQFLNRSYRNLLGLVLAQRWIALLIMAGSLGGIALFWHVLPRELAPMEDRDLLVMRVMGPAGANFDYMERVMSEVDRRILEEIPERSAIISVTSPGFGAGTTINSGFTRLALQPQRERERGQAEIAAHLSRVVREIPEAEIFVSQPATIRTGGRGLPVQFVVQHPNFERLTESMGDFLNTARGRPEFAFVNVDLEFNNPEVRVEIDRARAAALGVSVRDIAETLQAALSEQRFGYFLREGQQYEIVGQVERENRVTPYDLHRLTVRGADNSTITLDNLITLEESVAPSVLYRFNRFPAATFGANLAPGFTLADGIAAMQDVAGSVLDDSFTTELAGESREYEETGAGLLYVFLFALLLVFLVLSAQFESFRDPATIMLTVPLALVGGFLALWVFGQSLNLFSQIGLIMLIGLITKNGILLVEFANQKKEAGLSLREAIEEAAARRFRPILMTAISTIFGVLPIALALGAGAESRVPLGIAVIGGLIVGTLFTLFVIPAAYLTIASPHSNRIATPPETEEESAIAGRMNR